MATIGQSLKQPEDGWKRYDNTDENFSYTGDWMTFPYSGFYLGEATFTSKMGDYVRFNFTGTKIRIMTGYTDPDQGNVEISIDNNIVDVFSVKGSAVDQALVYEKTGLEDKEHYVTIKNIESKPFIFDSIDIDSASSIKNYEIVRVNKILLLKENGEINNIDTVANRIVNIPSQTEQDFIDSGLDVSDLAQFDFSSDFTEKHYIQNQSTPLGSGKVFEQALDVDKIIKSVKIT